MIAEQIPKKKLNIFILLLYLVGVQLDITLINYLGTLSAWATLVGWAGLILLFRGFYLFLQDGILSFDLKWMAGELHLERILGRGNHVYIVLKASDVADFEPIVSPKRVSYTQWFCHRDEKEGLYLLTTLDQKHYILKPSEALKQALMEVTNAQSTL